MANRYEDMDEATLRQMVRWLGERKSRLGKSGERGLWDPVMCRVPETRGGRVRCILAAAFRARWSERLAGVLSDSDHLGLCGS